MTDRPYRPWSARLFFGATLFFATTALATPGRTDWPEPAVRTGTTLPAGRTLALTLNGTGMYVPKIEHLSSGKTGLIEGSLVWNFRIIGELGLFGKHSVARMWWDNVSMLTLGNEVGVRFRCFPFLTFEYAYLGHRTERVWIESEDGGGDNQIAPGGVFDHGGETGIWGRWDPHDMVRVEGHLFGRAFRVYKDDQYTLGLGARVSLKPAKGHAIVLDVEVLGVYRAIPRTGVEQTTWNTLGTILWRGNLVDRVGLQIGLRLTTDWWTGEVPMLELKRSMIDEPTATAFIGVYFLI
jgi:hypothetical protein